MPRPLAPRGEHGAVGEYREVVIGTRERHRRDLAPGGRRLGHVDHDGARVRRRGRVVRVAVRARLHHPSGLVHHGTVAGDETVPGVDPAFSHDVEPSGLSVRAGVEHGAVGQHEHERVHRVAERRAGERCPHIEGGIVDFRRVGQLPGNGPAADGEDPPVGERGRRRIPARKRHVRAPGPRAGGRVEQVGVDDTGVAARIDLAADHDAATVGEQGVAGAEDVGGSRDHGEGAGSGIPEPRRLAPVGFVEDQDRPGPLQDHVNGRDRPRHDRAPLPDHGRVRRTHGEVHDRLDLALREHAVIDAHFVDRASEVIGVAARPNPGADLQRPADGTECDRPRRAPRRAVEVREQRRPVRHERHVVPHAVGDGAAEGEVGVACPEGGLPAPEVEIAALAHGDHRLVCRSRRVEHPGHQGEGRPERDARPRHPAGCTVENQGVAEPALSRPCRAGHASRVAAARAVAGDGAVTLVEPPRGDQSGRRLGRGRYPEKE